VARATRRTNLFLYKKYQKNLKLESIMSIYKWRPKSLGSGIVVRPKADGHEVAARPNALGSSVADRPKLGSGRLIQVSWARRG